MLPFNNEVHIRYQPISFFETDTDNFKKFFTDIRLAMDTDNSKICLPIYLPIFHQSILITVSGVSLLQLTAL